MDWAHAEINEIAAALASAQGEFGPVVKKLTAEVQGKSRSGSDFRYSYSYADLAEVVNAILAALSKNGIALLQPAQVVSAPPRFQGDVSCLVQVQTILMHKSGQVLAFDPFELRSDSQGPQAVGSTLTYARRYSLQACLGIAPEFDDDGAAGQGSQPGGAGSKGNKQQRQQGKQQQQPNQRPPQQSQLPPKQQAADTRAQQPPPKRSEQYERLVSHIRGWVTEYPELFPDSKAVWEAMRPAIERRGLSSANIMSLNDPAVFEEITAPVADLIVEFNQVEGAL